MRRLVGEDQRQDLSHTCGIRCVLVLKHHEAVVSPLLGGAPASCPEGEDAARKFEELPKRAGIVAFEALDCLSDLRKHRLQCARSQIRHRDRKAPNLLAV
jgi:hypothetical protein